MEKRRLKCVVELSDEKHVIICKDYHISFGWEAPTPGTATVLVPNQDLGISSGRRIVLSLVPGEYGIELTCGMFEHDLVEGTDGHHIWYGEALFDSDKAMAIIRTPDGQDIPVAELKEFKPIGTSLNDDVLPDCARFVRADLAGSSTANGTQSVYELYTDGSCLDNPGNGGYAYVIINDGEVVREKQEFLGKTTNNIAEISAVINGLTDALTDNPSRITVFSDSKYVVDGISSWIHSWKKNNWAKASGEPIKNLDYWKRLDDIVSSSPARIKFVYVKGHDDVHYNERCDYLAREAATNGTYIAC